VRHLKKNNLINSKKMKKIKHYINNRNIKIRIFKYINKMNKRRKKNKKRKKKNRKKSRNKNKRR
jgi:hypothetical protein